MGLSRGSFLHSLSLVNEDEEPDAVLEFFECLSEREGSFFRLAVADRAADAPMNDAWIAGPFCGEVIGSLFSDADDEIHASRVGFEVFVASFALEALLPKALCLHQVDRKWLDFGGGMNSGAKSSELLGTPSL